MTFTRVGVIVVITAVAVYFGLNILLPRHAAEQKASATTTPDQVFSSTSDATPAAPADNTPAATAATPAPSADQQAAGEQQASASSSSGAPASSDATPPPAAPAATATETATSGSSSSSAPAQGLSEEEARKIAEEVGRKVATQVASSVVQDKQQPQSATESTPAADSSAASGGSSGSGGQAQSEPAAASQPAAAEPAAAPEAAPGAEPAPAAEPAPKKSKHSSVASSDTGSAPAKPAKSHTGQQSMDAISIWWPAVDKQNNSQLNLVYAGEAAFDKAAVLLFSDNIGNVATASSHIKILDNRGKPASGQWTGSPQNARMLIFKTKPGRYTVILAPDLAGLSGKTLGTGLHGPVYIH